MTIAVIGTGYVGVVTAVVFASLGHEVIGLDIDIKKVSQLNKGKAPFYEPGLEKLLKKYLGQKKLSFTTSYQDACQKSKVIFICVGTPSKKDGSYDSKYVYSAVKSVAENIKKYTILVIKSTVPPSVTDDVEKIMKKHTNILYDLASIPEFLREGSAVNDALNPDRVVIGVESQKAKKTLLQLHTQLPGKKVFMDIKSAQLVKYAANSFLASKISFINSLAILADKIGVDINQVVEGFGSDPRIGKDFLQAGLGYGGSCFPKDTHALIAYSKSLGYELSFLKQVDDINNKQIAYYISKTKKLFGSLKGKKVAVLGLAFKANTDDVRYARSLVLIERLKKLGAKIRVYDPVAMPNIKPLLSGVSFAKDSYDCVRGADVLFLVTEWPVFRTLDFIKIKKLMHQPNIADGRNWLDHKKLKKIGFNYFGIGRC